MADSWHQVYILTSDQASVARAVIEALAQHAFSPYDPFPGGTGTPPGFKHLVRHFVAPPAAGWVRLLGAPDEESLPDVLTVLTGLGPVIVAWLGDGTGGIGAFQDGQIDPTGLGAFLRPGVSATDLERLTGQPHTGEAQPQPDRQGALPADLEQLARERNVNPGQAARLVNRLTATLFGKLDRVSGGEAGAMHDQARAAIRAQGGSGHPEWEREAGRRLAAIVSLLTLPASWRTPDFDAVRDAYQAARRRRRNPDAVLLPDEREALRVVPDALAYLPVYCGK